MLSLIWLWWFLYSIGWCLSCCKQWGQLACSCSVIWVQLLLRRALRSTSGCLPFSTLSKGTSTTSEGFIFSLILIIKRMRASSRKSFRWAYWRRWWLLDISSFSLWLRLLMSKDHIFIAKQVSKFIQFRLLFSELLTDVVQIIIRMRCLINLWKSLSLIPSVFRCSTAHTRKMIDLWQSWLGTWHSVLFLNHLQACLFETSARLCTSLELSLLILLCSSR